MKKNRSTIRLQKYDYSSNGWYFITFCVQDFEEKLGDVNIDGIFIPNIIGKITIGELIETEKLRQNTFLDCYQIMPNHVHTIIGIGDRNVLPNFSIIGYPKSEIIKFQSPKNTIGAIIRGIKGAVKRKANELDLEICWQRNYYERIIRDETELNKIRIYIKNNPTNWLKDKERFHMILAKMNKV